MSTRQDRNRGALERARAWLWRSAAIVGPALLVACGGPEPEGGTSASASEPPPPAAAPSPSPGPSQDQQPAAESQELTVVFLGDSLTAGFGLEEQQAFPFLVASALEEQGIDGVRVVNGGVSGDTTAGGLRRLDWLLRQDPDLLVVALGGNDGLRGLDLEASEQNLREIVERARESGAAVLLAGMLIPPNYGPEYTGAFADMYPRLAKDLGVPLIPFLLDGVAGDPRLNQADGIHPTAEGQEIVARTVLEHLLPLVRDLAEGSEEGTSEA